MRHINELIKSKPLCEILYYFNGQLLDVLNCVSLFHDDMVTTSGIGSIAEFENQSDIVIHTADHTISRQLQLKEILRLDSQQVTGRINLFTWTS